ncbi:unnamed protein product, partial [Amoebophrya sp. A120]
MLGSKPNAAPGGSGRSKVERLRAGPRNWMAPRRCLGRPFSSGRPRAWLSVVARRPAIGVAVKLWRASRRPVPARASGAGFRRARCVIYRTWPRCAKPAQAGRQGGGPRRGCRQIKSKQTSAGRPLPKHARAPARAPSSFVFSQGLPGDSGARVARSPGAMLRAWAPPIHVRRRCLAVGVG